MSRFIFLSFAFLGWAFYEVSGGPEFQPRISAAIAEPDFTVQKPVATRPNPALRTKADPVAPHETGLIVARMIVADEGKSTRGITSYSMSTSDVPNSRKLVFSLTTTGPSPEIRRVRANNVNMRTGPGIQFVVVDTLPMDTRVKLLDGSVRGWVKLRSLDSGRVGWIQHRFISAFTS